LSWFDWLILVLPVCFVMGMGFYTRRYVSGVADFLSAGRLCGRYVICVGDVAVWNAFSRWPVAWWGRYFVFVNFVVPGVVGLVSTFWFGIGGMVGLRRLFRDLDARTEIDDSDDGRVEDRVPLQNTSKP
jgi:hypothetical protein